MIKRIVARAGRFACVGLAAVCLTDCRAPEKYPTTAAAHREHAVGHAPGTCDLCDLYYDARDYVVRIIGQGSEGAGVIVSSTPLLRRHAAAADQRLQHRGRVAVQDG